jgi:hypothetical protein
MNGQVTAQTATGTAGQPWNPPRIGPDATKLATLQNLGVGEQRGRKPV